MHFSCCLPLHWSVRFPPIDRSPVSRLPTHRAEVACVDALRAGRAFLWLASALTLVSIIASRSPRISIGLLTASGLSAGEAVLIGALIGPMQVAGRVMEFTFGRHVKPIAAGTISFAALAAAMILG